MIFRSRHQSRLSRTLHHNILRRIHYFHCLHRCQRLELDHVVQLALYDCQHHRDCYRHHLHILRRESERDFLGLQRCWINLYEKLRQ